MGHGGGGALSPVEAALGGAIAASTALPPLRMISTPTSEAIALAEVTMPWVASTGSRWARAKGEPGTSRQVAARRRTRGERIFRRAGQRMAADWG